MCYFHPTNRAALPCDSCGRFLCTVCDMPVGSRHLCPVCLSSGLGKEKFIEIIPRRFLWGRAAFALGFIPLCGFFLFMWPFLFISGGLAVVLGFMGWRRPGSLVRGRKRWMAVLGILFGLLQVGICVGFFFFVFYYSARK